VLATQKTGENPVRIRVRVLASVLK